MKNTLHMFTGLHTGVKIPFALDKFAGAEPVSFQETGGTILYGVGIPQAGIQVKEPLSQVNEIVSAWFQTNYAGSTARN